MHVLVAYDISDNKARRRFFDYLQERGLHSQRSVFECEMERRDIDAVCRFAASLDLQPEDSVALYPLCKRCAGHGAILGRGLALVHVDWMVV